MFRWPDRINDLVKLGVDFTRLESGEWSLGKEGGHSNRRILHVEDLTGKAIESAMIQAITTHPNITILEHHFAVDLIREKPSKDKVEPVRVIGLYVLDDETQKVETHQAGAIMLATGGAGQVYLYTSNPGIATGDGLAMAYRAGANVKNIEFIQFHPTTLFSNKPDRFLITEAVRGEGGILRNFKGEAFMERYDKRKDLAPRDIVARAIDNEMKQSGDPHMWLDVTHLDSEFIRERFPNIYRHCVENENLDITEELIPVVPACHYISGGGRDRSRSPYQCSRTLRLWRSR